MEILFPDVDIHPIDIAETLATECSWDFDRVDKDQISMVIAGRWHTYSISLAWSPYDETLRFVCSFSIKPPKEKLSNLYMLLNLANDQCWAGAFIFWEEENLMVYKYGLILTGGELAGQEQINSMMETSVKNCDCFYPAFQLVCFGKDTPTEAIKTAIGNTYGTA